MYTGLLHLHSFLRWVILILLLIAIYKSFADRNKLFTASHTKIGLILVICCDVMLLIGLYQWAFGKTWGLISLKTRGFVEVMKDPVARFFSIEHSTAMILAIILVHIGRSYAKKNIPDAMKHKRTLLFFGLALLIILISVPWPFREVGVGRHWFPGM
jgi:high-affinity nickel permease